MTVFLRILEPHDKAASLSEVICGFRLNDNDDRIFIVDPESFRDVPTTPFSYWVSKVVRKCFKDLKPINSDGREAGMGLSTGANFQWLRLVWEGTSEKIIGCRSQSTNGKKCAFWAKGAVFVTCFHRFHLL